eukprot:gene10505-14114_t
MAGRVGRTGERIGEWVCRARADERSAVVDAAKVASAAVGRNGGVRRVGVLDDVLVPLMAFAGLSALMGGVGMSASLQKLPGIGLALLGAFGFALGTVLAKRFKVELPLLTATAWQIGIGCVPVAVLGLLFETPHFGALSWTGWALLIYIVLVPFCAAYVCWFAALKLLPASVAAIGTMAVPVIGVLASSIALHEPLGIGQIAALVFTLAG